MGSRPGLVRALMKASVEGRMAQAQSWFWCLGTASCWWLVRRAQAISQKYDGNHEGAIMRRRRGPIKRSDIHVTMDGELGILGLSDQALATCRTEFGVSLVVVAGSGKVVLCGCGCG